MFGLPAVSRRGSAALAGVLLAASLTACTNATPSPYFPPPGVTADEVRLGTHQPLSGPAAAGAAKVSAATKAYFDHVNAQGGIHGRKITYTVEDDGNDPAKTPEAVRKLVEQDRVFAIVGGSGTATHIGVLDYLKDEEIPDLFVASGSTAWNQPSRYPGTFGFQTDYTTEGKIIGHYLKNTPALADKMICTFGEEGGLGDDLVAGLEATLGAPVALKQTYIPTNAIVAPQVQALKTQGCEVVVLGTIASFTAQVLDIASRLGFAPQFISSTVGSDYATVSEHLGVYKGLLEGLVSTGYLPVAANKDDPWIKLFQRINDEFGDGGEVDNNVLVGMSVGYLSVQALQRAGRELTTEGLIAAIEAGGFRGPGIVPLSFSSTSHAGYSGGRMSKVTNGVQNYFGPAYISDAGSSPVTEYTEPAATPPESGIPSA
jgi:ABC-type branched-subunit amino acid transport system substrate-binding protein